jgi:plasmid replication initiation protein
MNTNNLNQNRQIVISNKINEARFKMSKIEQKLFLYCVGNVNNDPTKLGQTLEMRVKDFAEYLEISPKRVYSDIRGITRNFASKVIDIETGFEEYIQMPVLSSVRYSSGVLFIDINQSLAPFLLELKNNFTKYSLKEILKFRSVYSIRLFQILNQYAYQEIVVFDVDKLRFMLDIEEREYKLYSDFKKDVLETALKEINANSSLSFTYKELKRSRKITSIEFKIKKAKPIKKDKIENLESNVETVKNLEPMTIDQPIKPEPKTSPRVSEIDTEAIRQKLSGLGISNFLIDKYFNEYSEEYIQGKLELLESQIEKGKVTSPVGYFMQAVTKDWQSPEKAKLVLDEKEDLERRLKNPETIVVVPSEYKTDIEFFEECGRLQMQGYKARWAEGEMEKAEAIWNQSNN